LIKKDIVFVSDLLTSIDELYVMTVKDNVEKWYELNERSQHTRFPVVNDKRQICGVVTTKDIIGKDKNIAIEKVMTKNPLVVQAKTSLAYVAHMMVWEGIEIVP